MLAFDLLAELIQESRSEGVGSYNDFREACGFSRATSFDGLQDHITDTVRICIPVSLFVL